MISCAVVLLHYGRVARTRTLHVQLLATDPLWRDSIFVFDNASPDAYPHAWRLAPKNLYWPGAFTATVRLLAAQGFSHVWFLNNDLSFLTPAPVIERAIGRLAQAERLIGPVGVYSPAVTTNPYHPQMIVRQGGQFRQVRYVDGIAPLVSVDFWNAVGGLDYEDNAYGYGVDVYFSSQAEGRGYACVVDHQVLIRHRYHSTAGEVDGFLTEAAKQERAYLSARLGAEYKIVLAEMAAEYREFGETRRDHARL